MSIFVVRTDLALEEGERIRESGVEIHGVILEEETRPETGILVTRVKIETKNGAKIMGKPIGTYVTLEAGQLGNDEEEYQQEVAKELSVQLQKLIPDPETEKSVLVVGLGNRQVTADALGPRVADNCFINRHIILEFGAAAYNRKKMNRVSCLVPGVMAQTGMESAEIVRGVVKETKPDLVLVVDALAARSTKRLNRTFQISDAGIYPGSGVGNSQKCADRGISGSAGACDWCADGSGCCDNRRRRAAGDGTGKRFCVASKSRHPGTVRSEQYVCDRKGHR